MNVEWKAFLLLQKTIKTILTYWDLSKDFSNWPKVFRPIKVILNFEGIEGSKSPRIKIRHFTVENTIQTNLTNWDLSWGIIQGDFEL